MPRSVGDGRGVRGGRRRTDRTRPVARCAVAPADRVRRNAAHDDGRQRDACAGTGVERCRERHRQGARCVPAGELGAPAVVTRGTRIPSPSHLTRPWSARRTSRTREHPTGAPRGARRRQMTGERSSPGMWEHRDAVAVLRIVLRCTRKRAPRARQPTTKRRHRHQAARKRTSSPARRRASELDAHLKRQDLARVPGVRAPGQSRRLKEQVDEARAERHAEPGADLRVVRVGARRSGRQGRSRHPSRSPAARPRSAPARRRGRGSGADTSEPRAPRLRSGSESRPRCCAGRIRANRHRPWGSACPTGRGPK